MEKEGDFTKYVITYPYLCQNLRFDLEDVNHGALTHDVNISEV